MWFASDNNFKTEHVVKPHTVNMQLSIVANISIGLTFQKLHCNQSVTVYIESISIKNKKHANCDKCISKILLHASPCDCFQFRNRLRLRV